jgi:FG-GAP-like repeat
MRARIALAVLVALTTVARSEVAFDKVILDPAFRAEGVAVADVNGDGLQDLITGKRFWAHGPNGDIDPNAPAVLVWFELQRTGRTVAWVKHVIDTDSGVGTQVVATDVDGDGRVDVVVANKKGVFLFRQRPG